MLDGSFQPRFSFENYFGGADFQFIFVGPCLRTG